MNLSFNMSFKLSTIGQVFFASLLFLSTNGWANDDIQPAGEKPTDKIGRAHV